VSDVDTTGVAPEREIAASRSRQHFVTFVQPHPLDFDWAFNQATIDKLSTHLSVPNINILCIGVPTLFSRLDSKGIRIDQIERNPLKANSRRTIVTDVRFPVLRGLGRKYDVVVLDAPWYPTDLVAWLVRSIAFLADKSIGIYFTLWPEETRPSARAERLAILQWLSSFGCCELHPREVKYEVPLFESVAFAAQGKAISSPWRFGDLIHFKPRPGLKLTPNTYPVLTESWIRFSFSHIQLAVRDRLDNRIPTIIPTTGSDTFTYPSVSRRDSRRISIDVWSSEGLAAQFHGTTHLVRAIAKLKWSGSMLRASKNEKLAYELLTETFLLPQCCSEIGPIWKHYE